jgi:hypothetical protein
MRRRTFDALVSTGGLVLAIILAVAGGLLVWGHNFADHNVSQQLSQQHIYFPATGDAQLKEPAIGNYLSKYAIPADKAGHGLQVTNGSQAYDYANHYIAVHMEGIGGGKTYSEISGEYLALLAQNPKDPKLAELGQTRQTMFMGDTLRGLLMNAYAFWKLGQIALIAAWASFIGAGVMLLLSALGYLHLRRVSPEAEVLPRLGSHTPAPVEL